MFSDYHFFSFHNSDGSSNHLFLSRGVFLFIYFSLSYVCYSSTVSPNIFLLMLFFPFFFLSLTQFMASIIHILLAFVCFILSHIFTIYYFPSPYAFFYFFFLSIFFSPHSLTFFSFLFFLLLVCHLSTVSPIFLILLISLLSFFSPLLQFLYVFSSDQHRLFITFNFSLFPICHPSSVFPFPSCQNELPCPRENSA